MKGRPGEGRAWDRGDDGEAEVVIEVEDGHVSAAHQDGRGKKRREAV